MALLILTGCSGLSALSSLASGGGTNVAANTQIGKENRQAIASLETGDSAGRDIVSKDIEAGQVGTVTINNVTMPWWVILAGGWFFFLWSYLLWRLPAPEQIWGKK